MMKLATGATLAVATMILAGSQCSDDAKVASKNLSKAADNFEIMRRIIAVNGITGDFVMSMEGRCSIADQATQLEVTCKHGPDDYRKHFVGLSDNTFYFVEQMDGVDVSVYHTRVTWKPQGILPEIDFRGSAEELVGDNVNPK